MNVVSSLLADLYIRTYLFCIHMSITILYLFLYTSENFISKFSVIFLNTVHLYLYDISIQYHILALDRVHTGEPHSFEIDLKFVSESPGTSSNPSSPTPHLVSSLHSMKCSQATLRDLHSSNRLLTMLCDDTVKYISACMGKLGFT